MSNFDINYYKNKYNDLKDIHEDDDIINHFKQHGVNEKRIFNENLKNFDFNFYISYHTDLEKGILRQLTKKWNNKWKWNCIGQESS